MSVEEVTMYRVVCDEPGCDASPQDNSDYWAWAQADAAIEDATDVAWTIRPSLHLCPDHGYRTVCMGDDYVGDDYECPRRDVVEADDGWMYCPEHVEQGNDQ